MAQKIKANPTMIGAFVLGGLALIAAAVIILGGAKLFTTKQRAVIFFEGSVNGLAVGSPVNFRGVRVGSVDKLALQLQTGTLNARIPVYVTLLPDQIAVVGGGDESDEIPLQALIEKGLRATLNVQSFVTGQLIVSLDFKPETPARYMGSPERGVTEIPAAQSDFDAIKEQFSQIPFRQLADDIHNVVEAVKEVSNGTNAILKTVDQEVKLTAAEAQTMLKAGTATMAQMQSTLASVKIAADESTRTLGAVGPQLSATLKRADTAFEHADGTLTRIDDTFSQLSEMTAPSAPIRIELEQTLRDLAATAESLRQLSDKVEAQPNTLIFGSKPEQ